MAYFNINRVETGNRIVKRRKEMNLSRDGLADLLWDIGVEISITSIGKWERGECDISEYHARALCRIFGCSLCELIVARLSFYDGRARPARPFNNYIFLYIDEYLLMQALVFFVN